MSKYLFLLFSIFPFGTSAQSTFQYEVSLEPVAIPNLPGLHSFAYGQSDGKWLIVGGRKDGLHARQPFNAFPNAQNNNELMVIDIATNSYYSKPLTELPISIQEQLQSTNMNFFQLEDTLMIIGGYAYSPTAADYITFPYATALIVSEVINAVMDNTSLTPFIQQITHDKFANTGGQLGRMDGAYCLVGGQRFDGRYNPMGHATYTQTYANSVRKLYITNNPLTLDSFTELIDEVHLRRRDYNLIPQIFHDGTFGYTISSGVFQIGVDLPFLYPVHIRDTGIIAEPSFNQYLSNYHSAKVSMWDSNANEVHHIFFGGISQYSIVDGSLVSDPLVPFVNTISLLTRHTDGSLAEYQLPITMPGLKGAGAEFIPNHDLPHHPSEMIKLHDIPDEEFIVGHIYGGIHSPSTNPFSVNQTNTTSADNILLAVKLNKKNSNAIPVSQNMHNYDISIMPNPISDKVSFHLSKEDYGAIRYMISDAKGMIVLQGSLTKSSMYHIPFDNQYAKGLYYLTVTLDDKYVVNKKFIK